MTITGIDIPLFDLFIFVTKVLIVSIPALLIIAAVLAVLFLIVRWIYDKFF